MQKYMFYMSITINIILYEMKVLLNKKFKKNGLIIFYIYEKFLNFYIICTYIIY